MKKKNKSLAVIDIGSSSIRLVIFEKISYSAQIIFNEKNTLNLGSMINSGEFIEERKALELLSLLKRFISLCKNLKKENIHIFASAAFRIAKNKYEIKTFLERNLGVSIKIISEEEEGILSAKGVLFSHRNPIGLVGDFGGGSFELTDINELKKIKFIKSLSIGHLVLRNLGRSTDAKVLKYIKNSFKNLSLGSNQNFYAVGGSFRALAKAHMSIKNQDLKTIQDYQVDAKIFLSEIKNKIFVKSGEVNKIFLNEISKSRAEIIPYSILVLENLVKIAEVKKIFFTNTGVREGVLYNLIKKKNDDPFLLNVKNIAKDTICKDDVKNILKLLDSSNIPFAINKRIIKAACWLTNISASVHPEYRRVFALERILYNQFYHIQREERYILSLILYFRYSNSIKDKFVSSYSKKISSRKLSNCRILGQLLRIFHHISGRLNYSQLNKIEIKINKKNKMELIHSDKKVLISGQSIERGIRNINEALKTLK